MKDREKRQKALELVPDEEAYRALREAIGNADCCYYEVFAEIKKLKPSQRNVLVEALSDSEAYQSEWAYRWRLHVGNADAVIDYVREKEWAFRWGRDFGDKDVMADRIGAHPWSTGVLLYR